MRQWGRCAVSYRNADGDVVMAVCYEEPELNITGGENYWKFAEGCVDVATGMPLDKEKCA